MTTDIRVLRTEDELIAAANVFRTAMIGFPPLPNPPPAQIAALFEPGRTIGAFVDGQLAGTADATTGGLTLPGGAIVGHAGVTHIGVLPSFTRRGLATELVRHQLRDFAARGEVVATLRASEATIYERYGYGVASSSQSVEVRTTRARLRPGVAAGGPVRLLDMTAAWDILPGIHTRNRPDRPGTIDRTAVWWHSLRMRTEASPGPVYVVVHGEPGAESGFARYRPIDTERWFVSDDRTIVVEDFFAPSAEAYLGLMRFLLDLDLVDRVLFWSMPLDDPLPGLLIDRRAAKITAMYDETWLRIVDARRALEARSYNDAGSVIVTVDDPVLQDNSGNFVISVDGAEPTNEPGQLRVSIAGLGAILLGGSTWRGLAMAGLAHADEPATLAKTDRLFAVPAVPHAGFYF